MTGISLHRRQMLASLSITGPISTQVSCFHFLKLSSRKLLHQFLFIYCSVLVSSAREVDEKVAAEVKAALETGVLKNHRNDTFTRLARNTARQTHAYKRAQGARQQKEAINIVDDELASLKESQKENMARIKELKAAKSNLAGLKGKSSKAESSSSGKVVATGVSKQKRANAALKAGALKNCVSCVGLNI